MSAAATALDVADTLRLTATPRGAAGQSLTGRDVVWGTSDATVATVNGSGLVTGVTPGTVTISATSEGVRATVSLSITPAAVSTVAVTPASLTIAVGRAQPLAASVRDKHGNALTGRDVTWASANGAIATVSAQGMVTAVAIGGPVVITATSEGKQASVPVTVRDVPVARVEIRAPSTDVNDPATVQLTAVVSDSSGNVLSGRAVTWSSDTPQIATVDAAGVMRSARAGAARVRARVDGVDGTLTVAVRGLLHRWTFSEEGGAGTTFRDDVGGLTASIVDGGALDASSAGGMVTLSGGARASADYVALPGRVLRTFGDATIEVWATMHALRRWSRVFDAGSGSANNLFVAWSQDLNASTDRTGFAVGGVEARVDNVLAPFTQNLQHHVVMSIDEGGGTAGRTRVAMYLDGVERGGFETTYRLRDLIDDNFWLGRSLHGDETANASYDEVRIHDRIYPPADIRQSFVRGPVRSASATTIAIGRPNGMRDTVRGVGVRFPLQAVGRDAQGRQFPVIGATTWSSSNPAVATVDSLGVVNAVAVGRTEITATVGGSSGRWTAEVVRTRRLSVDPYLATPIANALWEVPVVLVEYHPSADGASLDVAKAPDFYGLGPMSLDSLERYTLALSQRRKMAVEQGSRFRGYKDAAARPSLGYRVVEHIIVYDQVPPHPTSRATGIPGAPRFENWHAVFADLQLAPLMTSRRVRELWVTWSYFDGNFPSYDPRLHKVDDMRALKESNMASPTTGDISNSDRDPNDAPLLPHTYVIYGNNFRRSQAEAVHNVGHQLEAMLSHVNQRQDGNTNLFWRQFVGLDAGGRFVPGRAGATHFPPNATQDYDYLNTRLLPSDIEDWRPDNSGAKKDVNVNTWGNLVYPWPGASNFGQRVESQWYTYWFQNFPGLGNRIPHGGNWMTNWWAFVADWDTAIRSGLGLYGPTPAAVRGLGAPLRVAPPASHAPTSHPERRPPR